MMHYLLHGKEHIQKNRPILKMEVNRTLKKTLIKFTVNGREREAWVQPNDLLINLLRDELYHTGTKYGCGIGECGACTVFLNDEPVLSFPSTVIASTKQDKTGSSFKKTVQAPHCLLYTSRCV